MRTRAAALALLLVLAGCAGGPAPGGTDDPDETPTATTTTRPSGNATVTPTTDGPADTTAPTTTGTETVRATFLVDGGENVTVTLEVADEPGERREGLMGRESLPRNHGMVFVYDEAGPRSFWMKDTLIPLDMVFVGADRRVLNVEHAVVQPNASDADLRRYRSDGAAQFVVELNRGFANRTGVGPGTEVVFHGPLTEEERAGE